MGRSRHPLVPAVSSVPGRPMILGSSHTLSIRPIGLIRLIGLRPSHDFRASPVSEGSASARPSRPFSLHFALHISPLEFSVGDR